MNQEEKEEVVRVDSLGRRRWGQRAGVVGADDDTSGEAGTVDLVDESTRIRAELARGHLFNGPRQSGPLRSPGELVDERTYINQKHWLIGDTCTEIKSVFETDKAGNLVIRAGQAGFQVNGPQTNEPGQTKSTLNGAISAETIRLLDEEVSKERGAESLRSIDEHGHRGPLRAIKGSSSVESYQRALNNLTRAEFRAPKCVQLMRTRATSDSKYHLIGCQESKRYKRKQEPKLSISVSFQSSLRLKNNDNFSNNYDKDNNDNEIHLLANNVENDPVRRDDILKPGKLEREKINFGQGKSQEDAIRAINSSATCLGHQSNNSSHQKEREQSMSSNMPRTSRATGDTASSGSGATQLAASSAPRNNSNNHNKSAIEPRQRKHLMEDEEEEEEEEGAELATGSQQKQRQHKFRIDDRRSTFCSSVGLTSDLNYDSSISSGANCSDLNQTNCTIMHQQQQPVRELSQPKARLGSDGNNNNNEGSGQGAGGQDRQFNVVINKTTTTTTTTGRRNKSIGGPADNMTPGGLDKRDNWDKNIEFLLAVIGFAVDLGNVWRFPYICYKNGGGAFLIPYTVMFILGGLPIFYLEMSLGQYFSSGCLTVWRRVCPMAKGIGYAMCVLNFFTGLYYNTIISWAVFFFVESFTYKLPWTTCDNHWNSGDCKTIEQRQESRQRQQSTNSSTEYLLGAPVGGPAGEPANQSSAVHFSSPTKDYFEREVLQVHMSTGIDDLGSIRKPLAIYLAIVFVCIYFAIWKGVKSTGKAVWITALLPYFVLIPLLFRGVFLEGAWLGIEYYLYPDWAKIMDVDVWVEAAKQIYFSLGPGFGTLMALSSYNKFNHNCRRDALIAASVNYFASFISGLVIFAVLGYMATIENVSVEEVAAEGPGLVFQVYPEGLATMSFSAMWSVLFFMMVITLGIDSTFGGLESVITGLCDEYPRVLRAHRGIFIGLLIILIYLCSLPTTTYGGNFVIYLLESYGTSLSLLFIVLIETIIVCWLYGADKFCKNLEEMYGEMPGAYWRICWKYISPTILLLIFIAACGQELDKYHTLTNGDYTYPSWAPTVGLLMTGSSVCCVPIYAIYYVKTKTVGPSIWERLKIATRPIENDQMMLDEKDRYADALMDKIRDHNDIHLDTDI